MAQTTEDFEIDPSIGPIIDLTGEADNDIPIDPSLRTLTDPTPESILYRDLTQLAKVQHTLQVYGLNEARALVPKHSGLIHAWEPQMIRLNGCQRVVLMLGSCRKGNSIPSVEHPSCDTERVAKCLEQAGYKVLLLDMRQTCRRAKSDKGCYSFSTKEAEMLFRAVAININVALDYYKIGIVSVVSFAEVWWQHYAKLCYMEPRLVQLPHFHIDTHLGWFGKSAAISSPRLNAQVMTSSFKQLSRQLSAANILPFEPAQLYQGF